MLLTVGQIIRPHGVRGEVLVASRTDEPELRFREGSEFIAGPSRLTILSVRPHLGRYLIFFEEIATREAAEAARGTVLSVESSTLDSPEDPDEFHDHELIGLRVALWDGTPVGSITRIDHGPAHDMLIVRLLEEGRDVLVPFVKAIVPKVDVTEGVVTIDPPGGLLEL